MICLFTWSYYSHCICVLHIASDEESEELKTPEVSSVKGVLELSKKLLDFSDWQGNEKLSQAITRVKGSLTDLQLKSLKQSSIRSYLS